MTTTLLLSPTPASAANWDRCPEGYFCAYSGDNGTGNVCKWTGDDPDWRDGGTTCSWSGAAPVQSVYNHGTSGAPVAGYTQADYTGARVFCVQRGGKYNLAGTGEFVRSHRWAC